MKNILLLVMSFGVGLLAQSQWYFETGLNDAAFTKFDANTPTNIHAYSGLRDVSLAAGYLFPLKSLTKRAQVDGKSFPLRIGVGLGFDEMNLRNKMAVANTNTVFPVTYNLGQLQGRLGLSYVPTLLRKKQGDAVGVRKPVMNLILDAGLSYNIYTSATRTVLSNTASISNLKDDKEFVTNYPAFSLGAGFEFPLSQYTALYTKYNFENAFSTDESGNDGEESFSIHKRRLILGLKVDLRLKNHLMREHDQRIAELEQGIGDGLDVELAPIHERLEKMEDAIEHRHEDYEAIIKEHIYNTTMHHKGFSYIPEFKHVAFPFGSSKFDENAYEKRLSDLVEFLNENPNLRIKLVGYADAKTGDASYNLKLSAKRAKRVFDYLNARGVDAQRMDHIGVGETLQFSIDELAENRRTEIIILN